MIIRYVLVSILIAAASPALASAQSAGRGDAPGIHELESRTHSEKRREQPDDQVRSTEPRASTIPEHDAPVPLAPRAMPLAKRVFGWVPYWIAPSQWERFDWSPLTAIGYFSLEADTSGRAISLHGWPAPALRDAAHSHGVKFVLTVTSFGSANNTELLGNPERRARLVRTIVDAVVSGGGDGANIDVESVPGAQRENLTAFMRELGTSLRAAVPGAEISMAIPAVDWSNAFDVATLGTLCDYLIMMGYDYHWSSAPTAGPVAPLAGESLNITRSVETYLSKGLAPEHLLLGVPWYGYEWPTLSGDRGAATTARGRPVLYKDARIYGPLNGRIFDTATSTPWTRYQVADTWYQLWYDDSVSLALKYRFANERSLGGIGIWALGYQGDALDVWQGIHQAFDLPLSISGGDERDAASLTIESNAVRIVVARAMRVRVDLYDALGRHVATILDDALAPGIHRAPIDARALPRGLYVVVANTTRRVLALQLGG